MELVLNLAWALLAAAMGALWLHFRLREGCTRQAQLIALAVLLMILFPVISVSDDLQALQNPAEADCCVRRDHAVANAHSIHSPVVAVMPAFSAVIPAAAVRLAARGSQPPPVADRQDLFAIDKRPPPAA